MNRRCSLYRHFDKDGVLLYIGIAEDAIRRLSQHKKSSWFEGIATITIEWFTDRRRASDAEREAILKEVPIHNRSFNNNVIRRSAYTKTEVTGVRWCNESEKWSVRCGGQSRHNRSLEWTFTDFLEAVCHRLAVEQCLGDPWPYAGRSAADYVRENIKRRAKT